MIPQSYPLWIAADSEKTPMLVIGWTLPENGPIQPVAIHKYDNLAAQVVTSPYDVLDMRP